MNKEYQKSNIKVGLIVDTVFSSKYNYSLCKYFKNNQKINISHLIIQTQRIKNKNLISKLKYLIPNNYNKLLKILLWRVIIIIEKIKLKKTKYSDHFKQYDLSYFVKKTIYTQPVLSKNNLLNFTNFDLAKIRKEKFDLLIRCGSGILTGEILNISKYGIISFHHGDNKINRGGPPCFWEVFYSINKTGFIIQKLNEELDGGKILKRGFFPTQPYFLLNQAIMYSRSNYYMKLLIIKIANEEKLEFEKFSYPYFNKLYKLPNTIDQIIYIIYQFKNFISNFFLTKILRYKKKWHIAFYKSDWSNLVMRKSIIIKNKKNHFLADPFLLQFEDKCYCFMENYDFIKSKASICAFEFNETKYKFLGNVIEESFHISFPYIFKFKSDIFMVPETSDNRDLRIYRASDFPMKWKLFNTIFKDIYCSDSMIFQYDEKWWLFTNIDPTNTGEYPSELHIFYSDDPLSGKWSPHSSNPIINDIDMLRNAGILYQNNKIFRVSQKYGFNQYGESLFLNKINTLNINEYIETICHEIKPSFFNNIKATHHIHSNGIYTVFDFYR